MSGGETGNQSSRYSGGAEEALGERKYVLYGYHSAQNRRQQIRKKTRVDTVRFGGLLGTFIKSESPNRHSEHSRSKALQSRGLREQGRLTSPRPSQTVTLGSPRIPDRLDRFTCNTFKLLQAVLVLVPVVIEQSINCSRHRCKFLIAALPPAHVSVKKASPTTWGSCVLPADPPAFL